MGSRLQHTPASGAELTIELGVIARNYQFLRQKSGPATCGAAVKADAYGTGIAQVAPVLAKAGCEVFFVATINEGIELRQILGNVTIYVLNGLMPGSEESFADFNLRPVLNSLEQIDAWAFFARSRNTQASPAAIHFDTGMNRLGLSLSEARALVATPDRAASFDVTLAMSHLTSADDATSAMNAQQQKLFGRLLNDFNQSRPERSRVPGSLANSAGILLGAEYHFHLVRPGVALYGGNPLASGDNPMKPVIRLKARILQLRDVEAGDSVGYSGTYTAPSRRRVATLDVGYADGYLRSFSNQGQAYIDDWAVPVIGRISMDMLAIDVTDVPSALLGAGASVDLLGGPVTLDAASRTSGLSAYELLTLLGHRYKRHYVAPEP